MQRFFRHGMSEHEFNAMQTNRLPVSIFGSITNISQDRMADRRKLRPNLMITARFQFDHNTGMMLAERFHAVTQAGDFCLAGKRFDPATNLIYFGQRYYDPNLGRWLTPDPIGPSDSSNLYQYVFNNPYRYIDPNGESVLDFFVGLGEMIGGGVIFVGGGALEIVSYGGFSWGVGFTTSAGAALMVDGAVRVGSHATSTAQAMDSVVQSLRTSSVWNTTSTSLSYLNYSTVDAFEHTLWSKKENERHSSDESVSPPHRGDELGNDPAKAPKGYEWKGSGRPGSKEGSWVKGEGKTKEILRPDLDHPEPKGPHWDYISPKFPHGTRLYPDGSWEIKR